MSDDDTKLSRLKAIAAAFDAHDLDAIMEHFVDDCLFEAPRGPEWLLSGTTADGERIEVRSCDLWAFQGDKIALKNSFWKIRTG